LSATDIITIDILNAKLPATIRLVAENQEKVSEARFHRP